MGSFFEEIAMIRKWWSFARFFINWLRFPWWERLVDQMREKSSRVFPRQIPFRFSNMLSYRNRVFLAFYLTRNIGYLLMPFSRFILFIYCTVVLYSRLFAFCSSYIADSGPFAAMCPVFQYLVIQLCLLTLLLLAVLIYFPTTLCMFSTAMLIWKHCIIRLE